MRDRGLVSIGPNSEKSITGTAGKDEGAPVPGALFGTAGATAGQASRRLPEIF